MIRAEFPNLQWQRQTLWQRLQRIQRVLEILYGLLTIPLSRFASSIITRLPFSSFFFRPLFLNEVYMALGLWEPYVLRILPLKEGDVFVDIGAHIGYHTVHASRKVGKDGLVVAVEPDERNVKVLRQNIRAIKADNVQVYNIAVGHDGFLYLNTQENPLHTKTTLRNAIGEYRVPSKSLNSLAEEIGKKKSPKSHSFVVKIDIDREESPVIQGGLHFLKSLSPTLIVESWNPNKLEETLKPLGYSSKRLYGDILILNKEQH